VVLRCRVSDLLVPHEVLHLANPDARTSSP
jgi:hypothetical protein